MGDGETVSSHNLLNEARTNSGDQETTFDNITLWAARFLALDRFVLALALEAKSYTFSSNLARFDAVADDTLDSLPVLWQPWVANHSSCAVLVTILRLSNHTGLDSK